MGHPDVIASKRVELVAIANAMINGNLDLIEGVRKICSLRHAIGDPDNEVFMPIRAIESETDHFPVGQEVRSRCAPEFLERMDAEMKRFLADAKKDIINACNKIVREFA